MSQRDISSLPLSLSTIDLLQKKGYHFVVDLHGIRPLELSKELGISPDIAMTIIQAAAPSQAVVDSHPSARVGTKSPSAA